MQRAHRHAHRWLWLLLVPALLVLVYFAERATPEYPIAEPAPQAGQEQLP